MYSYVILVVNACFLAMYAAMESRRLSMQFDMDRAYSEGGGNNGGEGDDEMVLHVRVVV